MQERGNNQDNDARIDDFRPSSHSNRVDSPPRSKRKKRSRRPLIIGLILTVILGVGATGTFYLLQSKSPIPSNISKNVSFPIYYPDAEQLPRGYTLNPKSFNSPEKDTLLYSVNYDRSKKIVFSLQKQPSDDEIQGFYANYIPLRNQMQTKLGKAEVGAYNASTDDKDLKTVVSLPTNKGTWLLITAPYNVNQEDLRQILNSLRQ